MLETDAFGQLGSMLTDDDCMEIVQGTYDRYRGYGGSYQEPSRFLTPASWEKYGLPPTQDQRVFPELPVHQYELFGVNLTISVFDQNTRLSSLGKLLRFGGRFMSQTGTRWWLSAGMLLAASRTAQPMAWEPDADFHVSLPEWQRNRDARLADLDKRYTSTVEDCFSHGLKVNCKVYDVGEDIVYVEYLEEPDIYPHHLAWCSRLVDRRTGYFVDVEADFVEENSWDVVVEQGCIEFLGGRFRTWSSNETVYMTMLQEYFDNDLSFPLERLDERTQYQCKKQDVSAVGRQSDPFELIVARPCGAAEDAEWSLASVDLKLCTKVEQNLELLRRPVRLPIKMPAADGC